MPAKCANPYCPRVFRRLREGTLLMVDPQRSAGSPVWARKTEKQRPQQTPRYYWLCQECSRSMSLAWEKGKLSLKFKETA